MKTERHLMIDIETMDSGPEAAVIAIGARIFTLDGPSKGFETFIDTTKAAQIGTMSTETMAWWGKQPSYDQAFSGKLEPADAFHRFAEFCKEQKAEYVWANSPSFDCVIMRHLAKQVALKFPFHYRAERDCRTLFALGRAMEVDCKDLWGNPDRRAHLPLDDATTQAEVAVRILRNILSSPGVYSDLDSVPPPSVPERSAEPSAATAGATLLSRVLRGSSG